MGRDIRERVGKKERAAGEGTNMKIGMDADQLSRIDGAGWANWSVVARMERGCDDVASLRMS